MGIRNSNDPRGSNVPLVDARIGTAFAIVEKVSDAIDQIRYVAEHLYAVQLKDVEFNNDVTGEVIQWRYVGETAWRTLVTYTDLLGSDITNVVADMVALRDEMLGIAVQGVNEMNAQNLSGLLDKVAARQNLGLGNVDNTSDMDKPISLAAQLALDLKADAASLLAHATNINNPHQVTKAQVGLGNVDNTSDMDKPISTATDAALIGLDEEISILRVTKEDSLPTLNATIAHFLRGDKTWVDFATTVRDTVLTGLSTATNRVVVATDSFLTSIGLLQKQVSDNKTVADNHIAALNNPHAVTKAQVGLGNVDNTSDINKPISTATQNALNLKADLVGGKIPVAQIPGSVDDVLEYANYAALPNPGQSNALYVTLDTNNVYRWSGSTYIEIAASPGSTDEVAEGVTNKYFTDARARTAVGTYGIGAALASLGVYNLNNATVGAFISVNGAESDAVANNWPVTGSSAGTLVWYNVLTYGATTRITQRATQIFSGSNQNRTWVREKHDSTWSAWRELASVADTVATPSGLSVNIDNADINLRTTTGFYRGGNLANAPDTGSWFLTVEAASTSYVKQTITAYGGTRPTYPRGTTFVRICQNGIWEAWQSIGGGASGGGSDKAFYENDSVITTSYTIPAGKNAGMFGPITFNDGVVVTVPDGSVLTIVQ